MKFFKLFKFLKKLNLRKILVILRILSAAGIVKDDKAKTDKETA